MPVKKVIGMPNVTEESFTGTPEWIGLMEMSSARRTSVRLGGAGCSGR